MQTMNRQVKMRLRSPLVGGDEHDEDDKCNDMNKTTLLRLC